mgnify:CR=1 FL=1
MRNFLSRFASLPALIAPERSAAVSGMITTMESSPRLAFMDDQEKMREAMSDDFWPEADSWLAQFRPYNVKDGVLTIPVQGMLLHGFPYQCYDWATGYEYIQKAYERGLEDYNVKGIVFDINSPGGEVQGNFDLVDSMFISRGKKPTAAMANPHAYSAAYNIASAADTINVDRIGGVGSIGVVTSHVDFSKYLEKAGIAITFIFAGAHKVDGNPYQPLPDAVKARIQERIDSLYTIFVDSVARNRGMDEKEVRATEALTYTAKDAIEIGLADTEGPKSPARATFVAAVNKPNGVKNMTTTTKAAATETPAENASTVTAADVEKAKADGMSEGMKAAKTRITAILALDEAKTRPAAANSLAMNTDLSVEAAKAALAGMPEEGKTKTNANAFDRAMSSENPNLGPAGGEEANGEDRVARVLAAQAAVHGKRPDKKVTA